MKSLIALIFLLQSGFASQAANSVSIPLELVTYNPLPYSPGHFALAYQDYQDIRIDTDLDGKIDYWFLKKGPLEVTTIYSHGEVQAIYGKRSDHGKTSEFLYENKKDKLVLTLARNRRSVKWSGFEQLPSIIPNTFNMRDAFQKCEGTKNATEVIQAAIQGLNHDMLAEQVKKVLVAPACKDKLSPTNIMNLDEQITQTAASADPITDCLIRSAITNHQANILFQKWNLQKYELSKENKPVFTCQDDSKSEQTQATTDEASGTITFYKKQFPDNPEVIKKLVDHELLHRIGLNEDEVHKVESCDLKGFHLQENKETTQNGLTLEGIPSLVPAWGHLSDAQEALNKASQKTAQTTNVAAQVSTATPVTLPANQASQLINNSPPKTDDGINDAIVASNDDSNGVLRSANNIIGSVSSVASAAPDDPPDTSSDIGTAFDSYRGVASMPSGSIQSNEQISKGVDFTRNTSSLSSSPPADAVVQAAAAPTAITAKLTPRAPVTTPTDNTTVTPQADVSSANTATTKPSMASNTSSSGSSGTVGSKASSNHSSTSSSASGPTREEMITFFTSGDYNDVKKKLSDPQFVKSLQSKDVSITVIDLYGNSYGAVKGKIILDEGDRFVQQN